jgi:DNA-binding XRE family transcriptional regulator
MTGKNPLHNNYYLLGRRMQHLRQKRGYTQEMLAEKLKITTSHLGAVEVGLKKPSVDLLFAIAKMLDVKKEELFKF